MASIGLKLFMVLLGSKAPNRNVEQHDYFFGVAASLKELVPAFRTFWPEAGNSLHIDGWREVTCVDGYRVEIYEKDATDISQHDKRLFFVNLGGYTEGKLEEQHYTLLSVWDDKAQAVQQSKKVPFFKASTIAKVKGANAHIDEKYGIDVDEVYRIEDIWQSAEKHHYGIKLTAEPELPEDEIHLGYFRLEKL
ncbi:MAG: DUF1543 domain-containing protein [Flavobacteriales bacterium]|nr:MAG: DUF1543 domain-containing protein [Flavobacteriales bacterium]